MDAPCVSLRPVRDTNIAVPRPPRPDPILCRGLPHAESPDTARVIGLAPGVKQWQFDIIAAPSLRMGLLILRLSQDAASASQKAPLCQQSRTPAQGDPALAAQVCLPIGDHKLHRPAIWPLAQFLPPPCHPISL